MGTPKREIAGTSNSVRIIGGAWRGRRVAFPDLPGLRPTPDRVRETLFNWLQNFVGGAKCLDLFAGSGALGLEALSRGAQEVVFVEQAPVAARALHEQLTRLKGLNRATIMTMDAARYLRSRPRPFDLVFMDPPFGRGVLGEHLPLLETGAWLSEGGLVYLEDVKTAGVPQLPVRWELLKSKSAGEVGYHLARAKALVQSNE